MAAAKERLNSWLGNLDTRISLAVHVATLVASFTLPAWAVWAADLFAQFAPFSWVAAGFAGVMVWVIARLLWNIGSRIKTNAKYDARFIERTGGAFNPLDMTFERRRIYLEDFVLPSHPIIDGKTFIDCDIMGPANIFLHYNNNANPIREPIMDAVCLEAKNFFNNGIIVRNCIFRNCSFQRITMFALPETYPDWKDNPHLNWIGIPPTQQQIEERKNLLNPPSAIPAIAAPENKEADS